MNPSISRNDPVQNLRDDLRDTAASAKEDLRATANRAGQKVRQFVDGTSEELAGAAEKVSAHVHEKPVQSSLIALGIGFVLGVLLRR